MGIGRYLSILHLLKFDYFKYKYKKYNKHNNTMPGNYFDIAKVHIGKYTYGTIYVVDYTAYDVKLEIGSYCSISAGVQFILGGEHNVNTVSTFPFKVYKWGERKEAGTKGDIIVGSDVWIGQNAIIMSGVNIGQGAVIGAGAIVTEDVEPYSIVAGIPAKQIKKRLSEPVIKQLRDINLVKFFDSFEKEDKKKVYSQNELDIQNLIDKYKKGMTHC